tara:strand:+ start:28879 stop:29808 length:930 start_codon:yes stop_codon:yes gene_type:complete
MADKAKESFYVVSDVKCIKECVSVYADNNVTAGNMLIELVQIDLDGRSESTRLDRDRAYAKGKEVIETYSVNREYAILMITNIQSGHRVQFSVKLLYYNVYDTNLDAFHVYEQEEIDQVVGVACYIYGLCDLVFGVVSTTDTTADITTDTTADTTTDTTTDTTADTTTDTTVDTTDIKLTDTTFTFLTAQGCYLVLTNVFLQSLQYLEKRMHYSDIVNNVMGTNKPCTKKNIVASILHARYIRKIYNISSEAVYIDKKADALLNKVYKSFSIVDIDTIKAILSHTVSKESTEDAFVDAVWSIIHNGAKA